MRCWKIIQKRNWNKEDIAVASVVAGILMICLMTSLITIIPIYLSSMPDLDFDLNDLPFIKHEETPVSEFIPLRIIDIDPDTLKLDSTGKWITCYIELPDEYDVEDINC